MKLFLINFGLLLLSFTSTAQLEKHTWLVGGTGNFLSSKNTYYSQNYSATSDRIDIKISPNIGYFFIEKLAIGVRPSFSKYKDQVNGPGGGYANINRLELGPFIRYYFLSSEKQFNILTDISYQYGFYSFKPTKGNINTFSASIGSVIFFNTSVGLEFLLGYYQRNESVDENYKTSQKGFQLGLGFQIHLEK